MSNLRSLAILLTGLLLVGCSAATSPAYSPAPAPATPPPAAAGTPTAPAAPAPATSAPSGSVTVAPAPAKPPAPAAPAAPVTVAPAPAKPPAPVAPAAPATPAPAPAPPADPTAALQSLCAGLKAFKHDFSPTAFADALQPALGTATPAQVKAMLEQVNKSSSMACFIADASPDGQPSLLLASFRFTTQQLIGWQEEGQWKLAPAPAKSLSDMSQILAQRTSAGGQEVLYSTSSEGTGHYGSFGLLQRDGDSWKVLFQSPTYDHFGPTMLDPEHVLVLARNVGDAPLAWSYNAATPTNYQWLWSRHGDSFTVTAERLVPDPEYSINVFFGALQAQKADWLAKVATPEAIQAARQLKLDGPGVKVMPPNALSVNARDEYRYWSALPAAAQGPAPAQSTGTATAEVQNGSLPVVQLTLTRLDTGWVISGVGPIR